MGMGLDGIPDDSPAVTRSAKNIPAGLECCTARVEDEKVFLCVQEFSPEAWEALLNVPLVWGRIVDPQLTEGWSPARGEHAKKFPENQRKFPSQGGGDR